MRIALEQAQLAVHHGDVPVGAVVLDPSGGVLSQRHNERELTGDPTAHAEILALQDAARARGSWRLTDCTLVVTLEPCPMCAGAALNSRIATVVYGAADMKAGACLSLMNIGGDPRLNHTFEIVEGVRSAECAELLSHFFRERR
ncbi:MAG: nucleoside deaminase [Acidimicrobiales bacterium]|nr:nucleoside deaminase [Acidimicrobiales bacterium]